MKQPKIRFKGFTGEWEEKKFDSLAKIRRGLTYSPSNITTKGVRVLRSSNINEDIFVTSEDDVFVEETCVNIPLANDGDILITAANGSPRLVGKHAVVETNGSTMVPGGFMVLAMTDEPYFLNTCMSSPWYKTFLKTGVAGGNGAIGNLNKTALGDSVFFIPSNQTERESLALFFHHLDTLIQSTTKKIDSLKQVKAASLQSMFPQEGETTPRIRFKGFEGEWTPTTLGEVAIVIGGGTPSTNSSSYWNGGIQWFTPSEIGHKKYVEFSERTISKEGLENSSAKLIPPNSILLSSRATIGEVSINIKECTTNQGFQSLIPINVNLEFLYYLVTTKKGKLILESNGSTFLEVSANKVKSIDIYIPQPAEQKAIGEFFSNLDSQISLHSQRLEKLKQIKSACLDNMFV